MFLKSSLMSQWFREKKFHGLPSAIPRGGKLQRHQIRHPAGFFVLFKSLAHAKHGLVLNKTKTRSKAAGLI